MAHAHVTGLGIFANAIKRRNPRSKTVLQHHGFDVLSLKSGRMRNFSLHRSWVKNYGIRICNKIDLHVGVSQKTLDYLQSYPKIRLQNTYVLYNGVDKSKFYPKSEKKSGNKFFKIGCIGNFWAIKDQITLLKAIQILVNQGTEEVRVLLVGTGITLERCKKYAEEQGLMPYIKFIPEIPHNDLVNFYNDLDLFVLPSYYEAFGCVYTEAYACGVPFIAVENQGISELIDEEEQNFWLFPRGDYKKLSGLIHQQILHRSIQTLVHSIDINYLISAFCSTLNHLKK